MASVSLIFLVLILGLRHGLDADHLAFIDGQTRYNWRVGSPIARWVGTLFSFGHGLVVACVAVILGMVSRHFQFPAYFDVISTWVSVLMLLLLGSLNIVNLLRQNSQSDSFQITGVKGKVLPKFARETTNPFVIIAVGGMFALAADTVSQTSLWAIAAGHTVRYMPLILGLVFMVGMMTTDTVDSLIAFRMISHSSKLGQSASRIMGWIIVILAYGVSVYEILLLFAPSMEIDFETIGIISFVIIVCCYLAGVMTVKKQKRISVE
ncbi:hypothetical protein [Alicyclobacillus acidoterrestris]|uniref:Nickel/cobalt efflux system n=1 Tax=Alicyclobacillus acidoterrestris (strain ATCC 49025 / DSM 3922 / CIP 106132 / NCIMB 13137 / GD3B) TaxID=1356854 RepID=T0BR76_ALIAG|nr:hypothetical protein [Alicyclobacillus acidoterrestris]EPZ43279.1 hypothetical protein N007_13355 [Alicyclobacillus acidoterrestris ATCC 49025]UNO47699.1 sodium:proton antiporter [Alicyclobacillus acidoterrestris]